MFVLLTICKSHDFISSLYSIRPFQLLSFSADFVERPGASLHAGHNQSSPRR